MGQYRSSFANQYEEKVDVAATSLTLGQAHEGKTVYLASAGNTTVTVPRDADVAFEIGSRVELVRNHATNTLTVAAGSGVTIRNSGSALTAARAWSRLELTKTGVNEWFLSGQVTGAFS